MENIINNVEKATRSKKVGLSYILRYGLVVRIPGSHPGGPGSIPGNGIFFKSDS